MNPETQAAIAGAQAAVSTASATWWLFWATVALVVVGGCAFVASVFAVIYAYKAAFAANETLRLESEPILILTEIKTANIETMSSEDLTLLTERRYIIKQNPGRVYGIKLKKWDYPDDPTPPGVADPPGIECPGYETIGLKNRAIAGAKERAAITLELKNVGRSPAVAIEVDLEIRVPLYCEKPIANVPGLHLDPTCETDSHYGGMLHSIETLHLPVIPSQESLSVRIENRIGGPVTLIPKMEGRRVLWHKQENRFLWWRKQGHPTDRVAVISSRPFFCLKNHYLIHDDV